jgi:hypothetical protein
MPEDIIAPAPASAAPEASPGGGIDAMMAQLDKAAAGPAAPPSAPPGDKAVAAAKDSAAPTPPNPADKPQDAPKPADKPAATPPKPESKTDGEPDWSKAPPKWYKIYEEHKSKTGETIKSLESKIKQLETKPFEQAGDAAKLQSLEKQLEELRNESTSAKKELAKLDFTKSDEYRVNFVDKANTIYKEAVAHVQQLRVTENDTERAATQADFDYIRSLPLAARRKAANQMFGEDAADVLDFVRNIDVIKRDAALAVERHAETFEKSRAERESMSKREKEQFDSVYKSSLDNIRKNEKWGKWFSENPEDPEATQLLNDGFSEIESITSKLDTLPLDQQAAYAAVFKARAAAFPRMLMEYNRLAAQRDALQQELEQIRATDPGAKPKAGAPPTAEAPKGIAGSAAVFDQVPR